MIRTRGTKKTRFAKYHSVNQTDDDGNNASTTICKSESKPFIVVKSHVVSIFSIFCLFMFFYYTNETNNNDDNIDDDFKGFLLPFFLLFSFFPLH